MTIAHTRRLAAAIVASVIGAALLTMGSPASAAAACPVGTAVPSSSPLICQVSITSTPPSGTWTVPAGVTSVDVVVVGAGGGGNGAAAGKAGGGGSGSEVTSQTVAVSPGTGVVVTVGSGGIGGSSGSPYGAAGGSSSFGAVTARGGFAGFDNSYRGNLSGSTNFGGVGVDTAGGGGGGAGGAGNAASSGNGAAGGVGLAPTSGLFAGNTTKYGGGGGGGSAAGTAGSGTDGGGAGGSAAFPLADPGGVGAGGGGAGPGGFGGFGGSGTVIVRFRQPPAAPTSLVATPQDGAASITFTPGADGTSTISNYEYTLDDSTWIALSPAVTTSPVTIPTLTNGTTYSVKLRAVSTAEAGTGTSSSAVTVTPGIVPAAPTGLTATAGNASASVAFTAGAPGTLPIDNYSYSLDGGTTWTALSPAVTASPVTLTGLTNGTAYSVQLRAVSATGPGAASTAVSVTPVAPPTPRPPRPVPTPTPRPVPVPPLTPGGSAVTVDGQPQQVTSGPNAQGDGVDISGEGFAMTLQGLDGDGDPLGLGPDGALTLQEDRGVRTSGAGFRGSSQVDFYLDPPSLVTTRSDGGDTGITLGTATTDALGDFTSTVTLPAGVATGDHVLQIVGVTPLGRLRAVSLGVRVEPDASITLVKGQRIDEGRHDRITATGSVSGLPAGTLLTPYVRLEGRTAFAAGAAWIVVQSDGSFRWSRLVRVDRDVTTYVAWTDVQSNEVTWLKLTGNP